MLVFELQSISIVMNQNSIQAAFCALWHLPVLFHGAVCVPRKSHYSRQHLGEVCLRRQAVALLWLQRMLPE